MRKKATISEPISPFRRVLESKAFFPVVGVLFALVSFGVAREGLRQLELNQDINELEAEIQLLEDRNYELTEVIDYLHTDAYKERQGRETLGLQREGEYVVVVPEKDIVLDSKTGEKVVLGESIDTRTNMEKWKDYFFGE